MKPCSSPMKALAVVLYLASSVVSTASLDLFPKPFVKSTVHVVNGMKPRSSVLHVHCRSKDGDLGYRRTTPGQEFNWSFSRNIWNSTLFQCLFWWNFKKSMVDVFNRYIDLDWKNLYYKVTEEGIYFKSEKYRDWVFDYLWGYDTDTVPGYDPGMRKCYKVGCRLYN